MALKNQGSCSFLNAATSPIFLAQEFSEASPASFISVVSDYKYM